MSAEREAVPPPASAPDAAASLAAPSVVPDAAASRAASSVVPAAVAPSVVPAAAASLAASSVVPAAVAPSVVPAAAASLAAPLVVPDAAASLAASSVVPAAVAPSLAARPAAPPTAETAKIAQERTLLRAKIIRSFRVVLVFVGLFPWVLPFARSRLPLGEFGTGLDLFFFAMCHRRPLRTLVLDGVVMPLCSRCAGIFLGIAIAAAIGRPIMTLKAWRWVFAIACALMLGDVVTQDLKLHPVWHETRILTGVLVGYLTVVGFLSGLARDTGFAKAPVQRSAS